MPCAMSSFSIGRMLMPVIVIGLTLGVTVTFLRRGFPEAWARWIRRAVFSAGGAALLGFLVWEVLRLWKPQSSAAALSLTLTTTVFASSLALALSAVVWGPPAILTRRRPLHPGRRAFLRGVTGTVPVVAASTGPVGAVAAGITPVLTHVEIPSPSIAKELDGLTILQLTDIHLGVFVNEEHIQSVVDAVTAAGIRPDAIVLTGDICDDYEQLPGALRRLRALEPALGVFACIGNHEIYRGRGRAEAIYAEAGVEFLCDRGVVLRHRGVDWWLCGADDPARGIDGSDAFLAETVGRAMRDCPDGVACRVLLAHRPRSFVAAARHDVTLTLSGHTHGAQMALWGRSLLEPVWPESFLLGHYRRASPSGTSHLYTSAGLGHWMPFRLNCPCEAVVVTLRSGPQQPVTS
jgi:predicted MPP superfamily phosphohydrolase